MKLTNKRANLMDFVETLKKEGLFVFGKTDLMRLFGWSHTSVTFLLHRYSKRGVLIRLKNGLYALVGATIPEFYIANRLCEPSYVSLETALSFHGIIPETVYAVTSITTLTPRERVVSGKKYQYHRIQAKAFMGYQPIAQGAFTCFVADPEKALVDYYYFVARGLRKPLDVDRLHLENLNTLKLMDYASLFHHLRLDLLLKELFSSTL